MDCSKTEVFLSELKRMLKTEKNMAFFEWYSDRPENAIRRVQEWSDSHPVRTRLSVLKEQYPKLQLNKDDGLPTDICAGVLYGFECYDDDNCSTCWNTPI